MFSFFNKGVLVFVWLVVVIVCLILIIILINIILSIDYIAVRDSFAEWMDDLIYELNELNQT